MDNVEWHPFFYNGLETNVEVTKNPGYIIDQTIYSVEGEGKYESNDNYFTEFTKEQDND